MPAAIAKTIIITLSLLTALGIAILENPQVQEWVEEQRRKIAEALRSLGDDLDPQSRRQAEAFAYEGRLPGQQESEVEASANAVAIATGQDATSNAVSRRLHMSTSQNNIDLAERRRLGREYLARRNQQMLNRQSSSQSANDANPEAEIVNEKSTITETQSSSTFDTLVNADGTLRDDAAPSPPIAELIGANEKSLETSLRYANPFGDEYEMADTMLAYRSSTPKPPAVPPKIALDHKPVVVSTREVVDDEEDLKNLSFEEQLARALSLSMAENGATSSRPTTSINPSEDDDNLAAAIAASLKNSERASEAPASTLQNETDDELYTLSPQHTSIKPASRISQYVPPHQAMSQTSPPSLFQSWSNFPAVPNNEPYNTVASSVGLHEPLIDFSDDRAPISPGVNSGSGSPHARSISLATVSTQPRSATESEGFVTDSEADDFASLPDTESTQPHSLAQSEASLIEVEDVDIDSMSDDDGVRTPGSWTDVGSHAGESEASGSEAGDAVRI